MGGGGGISWGGVSSHGTRELIRVGPGIWVPSLATRVSAQNQPKVTLGTGHVLGPPSLPASARLASHGGVLGSRRTRSPRPMLSGTVCSPQAMRPLEVVRVAAQGVKKKEKKKNKKNNLQLQIGTRLSKRAR